MKIKKPLEFAEVIDRQSDENKVKESKESVNFELEENK